MVRRTLRRLVRRSGWRGGGLVLLVGHPRSGTTFLGRLLGAHPQIGYWEEADLLEFALRCRRDFRKLERHLHVDARVDTLALRGFGSTLKQQPLADDRKARADRRALLLARDAVRQVVDDFRAVSSRPVVLEKTPTAVRSVGRLEGLLPEARVVHIVRDARDVAASAVAITAADGWPRWLEGGGDVVDAAADQWVRYTTIALDAQEKRPAAFHLIRHEDLVAEPHEQIRALLAFLGLEWAPQLDEFLANGHRRDGLAPSRGLQASMSGRWRERLTPLEVDRVVAIAGGTMSRLGYLHDVGV